MAANTIEIDLSSDAGFKWEFQPEAGEWTSIQVPHGGWRKQGHKCDAGTYRLHLPIPAEARGQAIQLYFEAINFGSEVYVGKDEASLQLVSKHCAPWMPVQVDLTGKVTAGETCLIVVKAFGRNKYQHERLSMHWGWGGDFETHPVKQWMVPEAAAWLVDIAEGIIRGVRLRILPAIHLSEPFIVTSVATGTIQSFAKVHNITGQPIKGLIRQKLASADGRSFAYAKLPEIPFTLNPADERRFDLGSIVWGLGRESYWWPNVPYQQGYRPVLHNLELEVVVDGQVVHSHTQRFGFREFTWKGSSFFLNGIKCNLRGDNQQEANFGTDAYGVHPGFGKPTPGNAGWPGAVDTLLRLNFNVMRIHQVPPTPYMLDVCDELGLMIIDETPVRGSEGAEDWVGGWENMIAVVREMTLRDRNHPSVIIWSAANEIWNNRPLCLALQGAVWSADWTRPVIIDGISDAGPEIINMNHYVGGLGVFPEQGGERRSDRPYGETECVWPMDNALQGFAWMATSVRHRRLKGNADIRNYVLNNAFPNYVPGQTPEQQLLEKKVKNIVNWSQVTSGMEILPVIEEPWKHPNIILMQKCFNPCTASDLKYDHENRLSDDQGNWPTKKQQLALNASVRRRIAVFNDTFEGDKVTLTWQTRFGGRTLESAAREVQIPFGEHVELPIEFRTPAEAGELQLVLSVSKNGHVIFNDDQIIFMLA